MFKLVRLLNSIRYMVIISGYQKTPCALYHFEGLKIDLPLLFFYHYMYLMFVSLKQ